MADRASMLIEKGERRAREGKIDQARKAFRQALKIRSDDSALLHRLAQLELENNNPKGAVAPLRKLAALHPDEPEPVLTLAAALEDSGSPDLAEEALKDLTARHPSFAGGHNNLGNVLQISRQWEAALEAYNRALELQPDVAAIWVNAGNMLEELGKTDEAINRYSKAIEMQPGYGEAFYFRARSRMAAGNPDAAIADVEECLRADPTDQKGLALKAVLLTELGREDEARTLFDYDRFIRVFRPEPPEGFATIEDFNAALVKHIRRRADLEYNPERASTRGGWHSRNLLTDQSAIIKALRSMLQGVFQTYVTELPGDSDHPFLGRSYNGVRLIAQAQILENQGYLSSHIHPGGWVSSAYYLSLPDVISDEKENPGWLEFGVPTRDLKTDANLENRRVKPEEGMAVLFPSYFFHGTRPFESEAPRISLGVDLIPTK